MAVAGGGTVCGPHGGPSQNPAGYSVGENERGVIDSADPGPSGHRSASGPAVGLPEAEQIHKNVRLTVVAVCDPRLVGVVGLLDRPVYLYAEVDRLIGIRSGTARRWINGYERAGRTYDPILREARHDTEWVTWGEFVETRMLAEFRPSVPTARLRAAVGRLRQMFGVAYPLAHLRPYIAAENGELAIDAKRLSPDEEGLLVVTTGQLILTSSRPVFDNAALAVDANGSKFAADLPADVEFGGIRLNPERLSGQPTFEGRRVSVATIAGMIAAGEARADLAADYGLSLRQIDDAVRYSEKHPVAA